MPLCSGDRGSSSDVSRYCWAEWTQTGSLAIDVGRHHWVQVVQVIAVGFRVVAIVGVWLIMDGVTVVVVVGDRDPRRRGPSRGWWRDQVVGGRG